MSKLFSAPICFTHYSLLVDIEDHRILDQLTSFSTTGAVVTRDGTNVSIACPTDPNISLQKSFPTLSKPCSATRPVKHHVIHHIETTGPPVHAKTRRLAAECYRAAKAKFESFLC